ncbi:hypothetical protein [Microbispora sp. H11081]|uniref:hypothetical protein n=1 Tax=Microbispora sp. H11081 TaxID=2729107 RepID=UPI001B8BAE50|nr:hypothetical protein [Microbispora sp. H11081]
MDAFYAGNANVGWTDLSGDGIIETQLIDHAGDGTADERLTDLNGDGIADTVGYDTNNDGVEDVQHVDTNYDGVIDTQLFDTNYDAVIDTRTTAGPAASSAAGPFPTGPLPTGEGHTGVPPISDANQGFVDYLNTVVQDGHTLTQAALNPDSVSPEEVEAARQRSDNSAANTLYLEGLNHEAQVRNDITRSDYERQWNETARADAAAAEREAERAQSEADWAVWRSQNDLA